ncbi:hypothetical protein HMPREF1624_05173 [Sporothrix schenckii ATCC 58251]|uniref:Major facilitator superfamily (MFS) profile domain-containing protein n=1 Tax=Sporothrix schenckii (strain ATCC 58251 / de Perez 2211183) TaxID=1391915 RepID=U7PUJ6_SPOS1|nr:hypothetical protein HMPREF1624_05173 [Sporothrix schenckii ATCC 58251]
MTAHLNAEDSCLNYQPTTIADDNNTTSASPTSEVRPSTATASNNRSGAASASGAAPMTPGREGSRNNAASLECFTLGCSGIASGHHHAYLPDPWSSFGAGSTIGGAGPGASTSEQVAEKSNGGHDDSDNNKESLMAGAAKFASKRGHHSVTTTAVPASSPSSASASSVSIVGSMAEVGQTTGVSRPEPLRLVRTGNVAATPEMEQAGATAANRSPLSCSSPPSSSSASHSSSSPASRTAAHTPPHITFPEGGVQAWLVVAGSFCAMLSVFGIINTAAVFESWFSTHQLADYTASEIGWVFSLYLFIVFFIGIQVGPVFDRYGPRYLVAFGSVLVVASTMLLGLCEEYYQILLCYSVLGGLGGALLNTPAYACIAHFFNVRRGLATGVASTAGGIGGIVFPILLQQLLPRVGFAWSTRILGFILLGLSVPANLWLRTRLPLPGVNDCEPEDGAAPEAIPDVSVVDASAANDGTATSVRTGVSGRSGLSRVTSTATRASRRHTVPSVWPDLTIFRDRSYAAATLGIFFMEWGIFVPLTFIVSYGTAHRENTDQAYALLAFLNAGSVLGRFVPGLLADKFGRFNIIIVTIGLSSAVVLGLWLPAANSRATLITFAVLFGFASGSNLGLIAVCLGQLCDPSQYGRFYSTAMMVASFGTLSSVPIGGAILGDGVSDNRWMALIIFSGVSYMVALVCYMTARILAVGWSPKAKF